MKNIRFLFFILVLGVTAAAQAGTENGDGMQQINFTEAEIAQKLASIPQTGIFELDSANQMYGASPFLLGNNRLRLVFTEKILLSILAAVYGHMTCVDNVEELQFQGKNGLRKKVEEITLILNSDAYQKALYHANLTRTNALDVLLQNSRSYTTLNSKAIKNQHNRHRLLRCLNWFR